MLGLLMHIKATQAMDPSEISHNDGLAQDPMQLPASLSAWLSPQARPFCMVDCRGQTTIDGSGEFGSAYHR